MSSASSNRPKIDRELLVRIFFFGAFAFLLYQTFLLAKPFFPSLLLATMLAIGFYPLYKRLRRYVRNPSLSALIITSGVFLAGVLPLISVLWVMTHESKTLIPTVQNVLASLSSGETTLLQEKLPPFINSFVERISLYFGGLNINVKAIILENVRELGMRIAAIGGLVARNAFFTLIKIIILFLSLFFIFRDGERFLNWIIHLIPMETSHKQAVAKSAYETFWAVTTGVFLTAAAQGIVSMIGFLIAGTRLPVILGLATGFVSLLGASFLITIPVALFTWMESPGWGIFLLIWGLTVVGWLDNFLRPHLIGSRARMPFIFVFFSILGGIKMYGLIGLILGPVLVACVLAFIRIYKESYSV